MLGGRLPPRRWSNTRTSTDLQSLDTAVSHEGLGQLIADNRECLLGKFLGDSNLSEEKILDSLLATAKAQVSQGKGVVEFLEDDSAGKTVGIAVGEPAVWDSEHFRRRLGKVTLVAFDRIVGTGHRATVLHKLLTRLNVEMLFARVNMNDLLTIQALERDGAILTDVLVTFRYETSGRLPPSNSPGIHVGPSEPNENEELTRLASRIFTVDRFHGDPLLPKSKSDELYSKWVSNSLAGFADIVLVARQAGRVAGFITCKVDGSTPGGEHGIIDLVGVSPDFAGNGVGYELVRSALEWFEPKVRSVYVGTQAANNRATRLYTKSRFLPVCSEATLHLWSLGS